MSCLLGIDTGGTYTDAVVLDEASDAVVASAKSLTTRPDLAVGVGGAIDGALTKSGIPASEIAMVSLSTTLATNALVEGQGGKVALVFIGFTEAEQDRAGLGDAMGDDPIITLGGGHTHSGAEAAPLQLDVLENALQKLDVSITGFAVAASFATRNPAHEIAVRDCIRAKTGKPVTCSHELSQALGGPKRALTAVLNARLIGMIDRLISACQAHLTKVGITAPLMVVRGDGALVSAKLAREKPIETILSGPAASVAGARWLTGQSDALVSDIGGTTTDVCVLQDGRPKIDPAGAQVGPFRTMVEAVAMRTTGLGGDSEVHLQEGLQGGLFLGPRRILPVSLAATQFPDLMHRLLDKYLSQETPPIDGARIAIPLWAELPHGLDKREAAVAARLSAGPRRLGQVVQSRIEEPALGRLVKRGLVILSGITPSDAAHVLGLANTWDGAAAEKALTLYARRRTGGGERVASDATILAQRVVDQLTHQTSDCILQAAFAEEHWDNPATMAAHPLTQAGLDNQTGLVRLSASIGVPIIGLGASAGCYYGAVGERLGTQMIVPKHAEVANAIGAVVGQVAQRVSGTVTAEGESRFVAHLPEGPEHFASQDAALAALEAALTQLARDQAMAAGVAEVRITIDRDIKQAQVDGRDLFVEAQIRVTAQGRPRIAAG